jgi:hypothetical protein
VARAIVRYSLQNDTGSAIRNTIVPILQQAGFQDIGTGSWEASGVPQNQLVDAVRQVLSIIPNPPGPGTLDHVWVVLDDPH